MFYQINFNPNYNYTDPDECYITQKKIYIILMHSSQLMKLFKDALKDIYRAEQAADIMYRCEWKYIPYYKCENYVKKAQNYVTLFRSDITIFVMYKSILPTMMENWPEK